MVAFTYFSYLQIRFTLNIQKLAHGQQTPPKEETNEQASNPKPKCRRLDRKDGRGLVKDATRQPTPVVIEETEPT